MLHRVMQLLNMLTGFFALLFLVMLGGLYAGFDPAELLQRGPVVPQVAQTSSPQEQPMRLATTTINRPVPLEATSTTSSTTPSSPIKPAKKIASPAAIKKSTRTNPVVSAPAPLIVEKTPIKTAAGSSSSPIASSSEPGVPSAAGSLNQKDILDIVNSERVSAGLAPLGFNIRLSAMAEGKAVDMINKQYFAHVSPTGVSIADLAKIYRYEYIHIGENLALGDFTSSQDVMTGWMNSPGHRANILNSNYTEIGISVLLGNYQGREVWYAVQEFGAPLSLCPQPDTHLEAVIAAEEEEVKLLEQKINSLRTSLEQTSSQSAYNALAQEHNALVDRYNALVVSIKANITAFNNTVSVFNACIGSGTISSSTQPAH